MSEPKSEIVSAARGIWEAEGPQSITYGRVEKACDRSKSNIRYHFITPDDLVRAVALSIVGEPEEFGKHVQMSDLLMEATNPEKPTPGAVVFAEAVVWLARHGAE